MPIRGNCRGAADIGRILIAATAFFLAAAETTIGYLVPEGIGWAEGVAFFLLVLVLIVRPTGILGTVGRDA